jgi:hypothetical protein
MTYWLADPMTIPSPLRLGTCPHHYCSEDLLFLSRASLRTRRVGFCGRAGDAIPCQKENPWLEMAPLALAMTVQIGEHPFFRTAVVSPLRTGPSIIGRFGPSYLPIRNVKELREQGFACSSKANRHTCPSAQGQITAPHTPFPNGCGHSGHFCRFCRFCRFWPSPGSHIMFDVSPHD